MADPDRSGLLGRLSLLFTQKAGRFGIIFVLHERGVRNTYCLPSWKSLTCVQLRCKSNRSKQKGIRINIHLNASKYPEFDNAMSSENVLFLSLASVYVHLFTSNIHVVDLCNKKNCFTFCYNRLVGPLQLTHSQYFATIISRLLNVSHKECISRCKILMTIYYIIAMYLTSWTIVYRPFMSTK